MMIKFFSYTLPFSKPFLISGRQYDEREGVLLKYEKDGITALGEAAPLPGFSTESYRQLISYIRNNKVSISNLLASVSSLNEAKKFIHSHTFPASLQFGLFTLCCSFLAQKSEQSLHEFLYQKVPDRIRINAVIDLGNPNIIDEIDRIDSQGFDTVKIKAGPDHQKLFEQLKVIRGHYPKIGIRIDANQSWSLAEASGLFKKIAPLNIEYCEEPLAEPDKKSLRSLKKHSQVPIALDESLAAFSFSGIDRFADIIIYKPMIHGVQPLLGRHVNKKTTIVFTSSLEGAVGRLMTATLAAGAGVENRAHGLATGNLLAKDFWSDESFIRNGLYHLPNAKALKKLMDGDHQKLQLKVLNI